MKKLSSNLKTAAILAVVVLGLGGLATWDEWKTKKETAEKESTGKLTTFDTESVTDIVFHSLPITETPAAGDSPDNVDNDVDKTPETSKTTPGVDVTLTKKDGVWFLTDPVSGVADDATVKGVLTAVKDYKTEKEVASGKSEWSRFGLAPAQRQVELKSTKDGKTESLTVSMGIKAPVGYSVYIATDKSEQVFMGSQYFMTSTAKTLLDFRDKNIAKVEEKDVKSISYAIRGQPTIVIEKTDGKYQVAKPQSFAADDSIVRELIAGIAGAKAQEFVDSPTPAQKREFSENKRTATISWTLTSGATSSFIVAKVGDKYWGCFSPDQVHMRLPDDFKDKLGKKPDDFRDKRVFAFKSSDVTEVDADGAKYLNRSGSWYTAENAAKLDGIKDEKAEKPALAGHIGSLLVDLEFAKTSAFLDLKTVTKTVGTAAPEHRVTLTFSADSKQPPLAIDAWPVKGDTTKLYVKHSVGTFLYQLPASALANIKPAEASKPGDVSSQTLDLEGAGADGPGMPN